MPVSDSRRTANQKWKQKNKVTVSCTLYKADAEEFKAIVKAQGKTVNEILSGFVAEVLGRPLEKRNQC